MEQKLHGPSPSWQLPVCKRWTPSVAVGHFGRVTLSRNVFEDIDVAMQPFGEIDYATFSHNTVTRANGNTIFMTGRTVWDISSNVFTRDIPSRLFPCGTTDVMIGQLGVQGTISGNEFGWRGEHPSAPDGCAIDYEGGSAGVVVSDNLLHDSVGAGVMVYGLSDRKRNISDAKIVRNTFVRNGAVQTADDRGEIALMQPGSTGLVAHNTFFAVDTSPSAVLNERVKGTLAEGWRLENNTIRPAGHLREAMADTPGVSSLVYAPSGGARVTIVSRHSPARNTTMLWSLEGSWPTLGAPGTMVAPLSHSGSEIVVNHTTALNVRFMVDGLMTSLTATLIVRVAAQSVSDHDA